MVKRDHAIISFFDQVFDGDESGGAPTAYWTPLRYPLLINLARLFDDELAEKPARPSGSPRWPVGGVVGEVCSVLLSRVGMLGDPRFIEIVTDALSGNGPL